MHSRGALEQSIFSVATPTSMIQFSKLTVLFIYELFLIFLVLGGLVAVHFSRRRSQTTSATKTLSAKLRDTAEDRREGIYKSLQDQFDFTGQKLEAASAKMLDRENLFFNNVQNRAMKGHNGKLISGIHNDFYYVLDGYRELVPEYKVNPKQELTQTSDNGHYTHDQYMEIVQKNRQLSEQLDGVMRTMDDVLEEYASVFDDDVNLDSLIHSKEHMLALLGQQIQLLSVEDPDGDLEADSIPNITSDEFPHTIADDEERPSVPDTLLGNVIFADQSTGRNSPDDVTVDGTDLFEDTFLDTSISEAELAEL